MAADAAARPSVAPLLRKLAEGWDSLHHGSPLAFLHAWKERFASAEVQEVADNQVGFATELLGIHLLGTDDVHGLLLAPSAAHAEVLTQWKRKASAPRRLLLVFLFAETMAALAREIFAGERALVLGPTEARRLFDARAPREELKRLLRERLPLRALIPYNYLRPANGRLFFGRQQELSRLLHEQDVSFAIAGPGRIGKTSLIQQYQKHLIAHCDPRARRLFDVDFYSCRSASSQEVARFVAMRIDPSSRSHRMTSDGLVEFLRHQNHEHGGPLELLLDEVDEVCHSAAFDAIGEAAKQGSCRVVMCGRGELFKMLQQSRDAPLACRLELLRPGALEEEEARALLFLPLHDLGIPVVCADRVAQKVFKLTGRLPHLLQFYGKKIAELAGDGSFALTEEGVDELSWDFDTVHYVTSPLRDLGAPRTRRFALALLRENPPEITLPTAQATARKAGIEVNSDELRDLLNELVIANVLAWKRGVFTIASKALPEYAERLGYFTETAAAADVAAAAAAAKPMGIARSAGAGRLNSAQL